MSDIKQIFQQAKYQTKISTKIEIQRANYIKVHEWSKKELQKLEKQVQSNQQTQTTAQLLQKQKKVIISMLLQIVRLAKQQCTQKGLLIQQMLNYALGFINQHQKYYDMLSYTQIKHFRDSLTEMEKQYYEKNTQLKQEINKLTLDKQHRWRNIFMVVKDNRVLRRQKLKIFKKYKQQVWKTRQLQQDLINLRSQNQKYKLLSQQSCKQNYFKQYVTNQLLLVKLDSKIKQHPGRALRILKKQLVDCEINQLNSLDHKIKFIIQAMEQNGQVCHQFDDWDDNIQTTRLFYNVSIQTHIQSQNIGVNTITPVVIPKIFQSIKCQTKAKQLVKFVYLPKIFDIKINSHAKKQVVQRKKTYDLNASLSKFNRKNSTTTNNFTGQHTTSNFNQMYNKTDSFYTYKEPMRIFNCLVSVKINPIKTVKIAKMNSLQQTQNNITQQNMQTQKKLSVKKNKITTNSRHFNTSRLPITKKQFFHGQISQSQNIQSNSQKKKSIKRLYSQIYKVFYRPFQKFNEKADDIQNILDLNQDEWQIFLQQKYVGKQSTKLKDRDQYPQQQKKSNKLIINKYEKNKIFQQVELANKYSRNNAETILQIFQTQSNVSFQTAKNIFQQIDINDKRKQTRKNTEISQKQDFSQVVLKQNTHIKLNSSNKHRRQKTQNLQIKPKKINKRLFYVKNNDFAKPIKQKPMIHPNLPQVKNKMFQKRQSNNQSRTTLIKIQQQHIQQIQRQIKINQQLLSKKQNKQNSSSSDRFFSKGQKIIQKLMENIFMRRKQIIRAPQNIKSFLETFLSTLLCQSMFSQNKMNYFKKFCHSFQDSFIRQTNNICTKSNNIWTYILLQQLLSNFSCQMFAQDAFVLFAVILQKLHGYGILSNIQQLTLIPIQYGLKVIQYICSIYLSPPQSEFFIKSKIKLQLKSDTKTINIIQCYLKFIHHLQSIIIKSELWQFFMSISPFSSNVLRKSQIYQILYLFNLTQVENQHNLKKLSFYVKNNFSLHRLCLYAYRFQWKSVYDIKSWISKKYVWYFGNNLDEQNLLNICYQIQKNLRRYQNKFQFLLNVIQTMKMKNKFLKSQFNKHFLKLCKIIVLLEQIQKQDIFSTNLGIIQYAYRNQICRVVSKYNQIHSQT